MSINVNLAQLATLNNTSILNQINSNNSILQTALTDSLSLSGQQPNQMKTNLDLNSNQIINLPPPGTANSPARLVDVVSNPTLLLTVPPTGTSGAVVPFLNGVNTWSGAQTFSTISATTATITNATITNATITTLTVPSILTTSSEITLGTSLYPSTAFGVPGFRYNSTSNLLVNTIGCKNIMAGIPAQDTSVTWVNTYLSGVDSAGQVGIYGVSTNGLWTSVFAGRSSDNGSGSPQNVIPMNSVVVHDNTSVGHLTWAAYMAGYINSTSTNSHHINIESSIFNTSSSIAEDPYNVNPIGSSVNLRLDSAAAGGFGGNDVGAAMDIVNNGGKFISGIVFHSTVLDTGLNANPPAIALPSAYALTWYSAAATVSSRLYTDSSAIMWLNAASTNIQGTILVNNAPAGYVGELISSTVAQGSAVALTNGTPLTITSITLTAGDWDLSGSVYLIPAATTNVTYLTGTFATTTNTVNLTPGFYFANYGAGFVPGANPFGYSLPVQRISVSTNTTYFLTAQSNFTVSTNAAFGVIRARRVR